MNKGIIGYQAQQVSVLAILVAKNMYFNTKNIFPISYISESHLRKYKIRSNYESPFNTKNIQNLPIKFPNKKGLFDLTPTPP